MFTFVRDFFMLFNSGVKNESNPLATMPGLDLSDDSHSFINISNRRSVPISYSPGQQRPDHERARDWQVQGHELFSRGCCLNFVYLFWGSLIPKYRTVKLKKKSLGSKSDVEMGKLRGKESSCSDNERLTVTYSNNNLGDSKGGQEQELLDLVLKTKKNFNNRKSSISSDSSLSSSMLNKSSRLNHANNVSLDSNKLSTKINELNNTSLNSNNLKSKFNNK